MEVKSFRHYSVLMQGSIYSGKTAYERVLYARLAGYKESRSTVVMEVMDVLARVVRLLSICELAFLGKAVAASHELQAHLCPC